jgi:hypothetical protein
LTKARLIRFGKAGDAESNNALGGNIFHNQRRSVSANLLPPKDEK